MQASYQQVLVRVCFAREPATVDLALLEAEKQPGWLLYRRMVRARLTQTIEHAFPRLRACVKDDAFAVWIEDYFAQVGPKSVYLRDVPGEFLSFFESDSELPQAPPYARDLARLEWTELDVAYTFEEAGVDRVGEFSMHKPPVLNGSLRVLQLQWAVHRGTRESPMEPVEPGPVWVALYRDPASHDVRILELTQVTGVLLAAMQGGQQSLTQCTEHAAQVTGATIDTAWVTALTNVLADFFDRGILLGSSP